MKKCHWYQFIPGGNNQFRTGLQAILPVLFVKSWDVSLTQIPQLFPSESLYVGEPHIEQKEGCSGHLDLAIPQLGQLGGQAQEGSDT